MRGDVDQIPHCLECDRLLSKDDPVCSNGHGRCLKHWLEHNPMDFTEDGNRCPFCLEICENLEEMPPPDAT